MGRNQAAPAGPVVREVACKSILCESGICDFAVNCYTGCQHACAYCYARFMGRFRHLGETWGSFVDVKVNAAEALSRQLRQRSLLSPGSVFVSSVCDAYQPIEEKYQLTRRCLGMLLEAGYQVHVQSKSDLVCRDFDLMGGRNNVTVCQTITTMDETVARQIEPGAAGPARRVETLRRAAEAGIAIKAFVGPLLPGLTDTAPSLTVVFGELAALPLAQAYVDRLNLRWGVWPALRKALAPFAPASLEPIRAMLFDDAASQAYNRALRGRVHQAAQSTGLQAPLSMAF